MGLIERLTAGIHRATTPPLGGANDPPLMHSHARARSPLGIHLGTGMVAHALARSTAVGVRPWRVCGLTSIAVHHLACFLPRYSPTIPIPPSPSLSLSLSLSLSNHILPSAVCNICIAVRCRLTVRMLAA